MTRAQSPLQPPTSTWKANLLWLGAALLAAAPAARATCPESAQKPAEPGTKTVANRDGSTFTSRTSACETEITFDAPGKPKARLTLVGETRFIDLNEDGIFEIENARACGPTSCSNALHALDSETGNFKNVLEYAGAGLFRFGEYVVASDKASPGGYDQRIYKVFNLKTLSVNRVPSFTIHSKQEGNAPVCTISISTHLGQPQFIKQVARELCPAGAIVKLDSNNSPKP